MNIYNKINNMFEYYYLKSSNCFGNLNTQKINWL